jgi:hypothetical protein
MKTSEPQSSQKSPVFVIKLRARPGIGSIRSLRWLLKRLLRGHQLVCVSVSEERAA